MTDANTNGKRAAPETVEGLRKELNRKHLVFSEAYLRCLNATDAYQEAYPKASRETARRNGSTLLSNTDIRAYLDARMAELTMQPSEILRRMSDMAQASIKPFIEISADGAIHFDFSDPEAENYLHIIKKVETKRTRRVEGRGENAEEWEDEFVRVELHDAQAALRELGKHFRLFAENVDVTSGGKEITLNIVYRDAENHADS